ncbi:hypothetical protein HKI87_14g78100 [Chloropicon roscoffensis]|uniref:EF-hand domain-containing protein n=1 Tax=Chloropicon roscoffensis TaxID=1461544 RepID=A0AAX4PKP1_9CHLO
MATTMLEEKRRQTIERNKRKLAQLGVKSAAKTIKKQVKQEAEVLAKRKKKAARRAKRRGPEPSDGKRRSTRDAAREASEKLRLDASQEYEEQVKEDESADEYDEFDETTDEEERMRSSSSGEEEDEGVSGSDSGASDEIAVREGGRAALVVQKVAKPAKPAKPKRKKPGRKPKLSLVESHGLDSDDVRFLFDQLGGGRKGGITHNDLVVVLKTLQCPHSEEEVGGLMELALDSCGAIGPLHSAKIDFETFSSLVHSL